MESIRLITNPTFAITRATNTNLNTNNKPLKIIMPSYCLSTFLLAMIVVVD